ncbi:MAG TPA: right-handed parallel beta-helix repeat-containing protein [Acidimicrobiales bacterium]|nr:right-handed parallel beta-helix repeat-containing protein [Acidimicrobiales bacterium]
MRGARKRSAVVTLAFLGSLVAFLPAGSARAAGAVVNVPTDAPTIQTAIDAAGDGGAVLVAPGVYRENLDFHGRRIEVRSARGPASTVIDGGRAGPVVTFEHSETRATSLRGFTVRNGNPGGIRITNASPTITGNVVTANTAYEGAGFYIASSSALIQDNVVRGNTAGGGGAGGLYLTSTSGLDVVGNIIEYNTSAYSGGAMTLWTALDAVIRNNVFRGNQATGGGGGAIDIVNFSWPLISQNVFVDNEALVYGGALNILVPVGAQGAILANNTLVGNRAPQGSAVFSGGDWFAVNNIFSGPSTGDVVRCEGSIPGRFFYNDVYNGTDTPFQWCPDTTGIVGNISVDPLVGPDLGLIAGSPAIDAGHDDPLVPLLSATDANGAARVVDGNADGTAAADLGAFEWPGAGLPARPPAPGAYHPLSPVRILDTRTGLGGGPSKVGPGGTLSLQVTGRGGVPATGVTAVALNVTVTEPSAGSFLTAWPAGETRPLASNLNYDAGTTKPNMVVVKVGAGGEVNLFNYLGSTHVIADVAGWYGPYLPTPGAAFTPLPPSRLLDTRNGNGAPAQRVPAGGTVSLQVTGRGGLPATGVSAVALNVTVTEAASVSFLSVYPSGETRPLVSNLNYRAGDTVANVVVVKVGADGRIVLYNSAGSTQVIADVAGWYGIDGTTPIGTYTAVPPSRILDTRTGNGAPMARVVGGGTLSLQVTGRSNIPAGAVGAVVLNVTATEPIGGSFLTVWPGGTPRPLASNLNYAPGQTVPNLVVVQVGPGGTVDLYIDSGSVQLIADVAGWYGS